jgi:phosphotransferase system HPr (HPr) family protein
MEMRRTEIADAIQRCDQGEGVIILTDLFGGTPSNLAISLMKSENVEVIAGVNLPMLIRLEGARKAMAYELLSPQPEKQDANISRSRPSSRRGRRSSCISRPSRSPTGAGSMRRAQRQVRQCRRRTHRQGVEVEKDGNRVVGTSIMGLMMLGAAMGDSITIHCEGEGCEAAMTELAELVEGRFGEIMPRQITSFSNETVKRLRALRDRRRASRRACSSPRDFGS